MKRTRDHRAAAPRWYDVPKGTEPVTCRGHQRGGSCRQRMYLVQVPRARGGGMVTMPVDCSIPGGVEPTGITEGKGVSHFTVCPDVKNF